MPQRANAGSFSPGHRPWNTGTKGCTGANSGSFGAPGKPGGKPILPVGTKRWDTKNHELYCKVDGPWKYIGRYSSRSNNPAVGHWRPQRLVNFEAVHGPVPSGLVVRRLLPICDCVSNLVLIDRHTNALLNSGSWTYPRKPWRDLPLDHDLRLATVMAALAKARSAQVEGNPLVICECGCGSRMRKYSIYACRGGLIRKRRRFVRGHNSKRKPRSTT